VFAQTRHHFGLLRRRYREVERIMHLQQRNDIFTIARAHPLFGLNRRRTLDQHVQRLVGLGAPERPSVPRMPRIVRAALGFLALAWSGAFFPAPTWKPKIEMPACTVE